MKPPYNITPLILELITSISEKIGAINATHLQLPRAELRRSNTIKTIHASLAIEGNTLSIDQITALLDNKRVIAPKKDIVEVHNAISVYESLDTLEANSINSFLKAHKLLMNGLVATPGKFRTTGVGIVKGAKLAHLAPKANMVKPLMNDLFSYLKLDKDPALIKSCVFHYELEFIHPFDDGNGRMGRLWQTVILKEVNAVFSFLPVESIIRNTQKKYYKSLESSDASGNSTLFIEYMLCAINLALEDQLDLPRLPLNKDDRIGLYHKIVNQNIFTRKDYLDYFKEISTATASRDLKIAVDQKVIVKSGDKRTANYRFVKMGK
jgi:Fic family protein